MSFAVSAATVGSALIGSAASRSAASQQADAAQRATEAQAAAAAQQRADLQPWRQTGEAANNKLAAMLGLNGQTSDFTTDPSYQFRLAEGQKAVDNSAAARGSTLSGAALKALTKYGQGMASTEYQNSFNRLSGVSGQGQSAAAGQGAGSMQFGNSQANNLMEAANANTAGTVGAANAWSGAISQGINSWNQNNMINNYQQNELMKMIAGKGLGSSTKSALYGDAGYG
jgi:hypothetical protein